MAYFRSYGIDTRIARIFNTYGPGMSHLFIADMIRKITNSKNEIIVGGDGKQIRDYVYIADLINALAIIADHGKPGEDYNICSENKINLNKILELILLKMNRTDLNIIYDGKSYIGDIVEWYGNSEKLRNLGFNIAYNFEMGLDIVIKSQKEF